MQEYSILINFPFFSITGMTSLCFDNWESIASHLDLSGLINITEISSEARAAAQLSFKRRYSSHYFGLNWTHNSIGIETISMQQSKKLLQHFGHLIFKLAINLAPNATVYNNIVLQNVFRNINQYCTRNCHRLQLGDYLPFLINEPLRNVDELNIYTGDYSLQEFSAMFGNIRTLEISSKEACIYLKQRMRELKRLCIADSIYKNDGNDGIQDSDIVEAIALNPQIDRLEIFNDGAFEITRNNGAELELIMEWDAKDLLFKLIQPEHIERLDLIYEYEIGEFGEFIMKFINLKCLTMDTCHDELFDVIDSLPKLQELHICFEKFDYDAEEFEDIEWFLSTIKVHEKLSVFSFHFEDEKNRRIFQTVIKPAVNDFFWNISIIDNADGPYGYKYSFVLNTIRSVSN